MVDRDISSDIIKSWVFDSNSRRCEHDATLCDEVCQWLATDRYYSLVLRLQFFKNHHNIAEILLRVVIPIKSTKACELDFRLRLSIGYPVEALWFPFSKRLLSRLSVQSFDYDEIDSRINIFTNDKQSLRTRTLFSYKSFDHTSIYGFWF